MVHLLSLEYPNKFVEAIFLILFRYYLRHSRKPTSEFIRKRPCPPYDHGAAHCRHGVPTADDRQCSGRWVNGDEEANGCQIHRNSFSVIGMLHQKLQISMNFGRHGVHQLVVGSNPEVR